MGRRAKRRNDQAGMRKVTILWIKKHLRPISIYVVVGLSRGGGVGWGGVEERFYCGKL